MRHSKGTGGNATTAVVYGVIAGQGSVSIYIGPSTINGSGTEFADGDSFNSTGGATGTIAAGGIGTAGDEFIFKHLTTTEWMYIDNIICTGGQDLTIFGDRAYRFDVSDSYHDW